MIKNTARRPNIHWKMEVLRKNGFVEDFKEHCENDTILGLYLPRPYLEAWVRYMDPTATDVDKKLAAKVMDENPPEMTLRKNDEARTLLGTYNESTNCPPPENCS